MITSLRFLLLILFGLFVYPNLLQAQIGINSPAGVSPTQDVEIYTRNGFLVQQKYVYPNADPNTSINNLTCANNPPNLTALAGILKDPAGDANYTAGMSYSCAQGISISSTTTIVGIELVFEDLDTELTNDYVSVTDSYGNEQRFSGSTLPARLIITSYYVLIKFVTDSDANAGRGFRLRWHALIQETLTKPTSIAFGNVMQFDTYYSSLKVGFGNKAIGYNSTALGYNNTSSGTASTASGYNSLASGTASMALGGNNIASGPYSTALGFSNKAIGDYSTALGYNNIANGSSIILGGGNTTSGISMALGYNNTANGNYSTVLGNYMNTNTKQGAFMIGDSDPLSQGTTFSGLTDQFVARFLNGYFLLTGGDVSPGGGTYGTVRTGVIISRGQNSWGSISDSTKKERFQPIDPVALLRKIGAMKLTTWNYKGQHQIRHYGPMAQDFYAAFGQDGLGQVGCDTLIYSHDFAGVTFTGVQALIRENEQLKTRLAALEEEKKRTEVRLNEVTDLRARLDALERRWLTPSNPVSTAAQPDTRQKSK